MKHFCIPFILLFCKCNVPSNNKSESKTYLHITKSINYIQFEIKGNDFNDEKRNFFSLERMTKEYGTVEYDCVFDTLNSNNGGKIIDNDLSKYANFFTRGRYYIFNGRGFANKSIVLDEATKDTLIELTPKFKVEINYVNYVKQNSIDSICFFTQHLSLNHINEVELNLITPIANGCKSKNTGEGFYGGIEFYLFLNESLVMKIKGYRESRQLFEKKIKLEKIVKDTIISIK